MPKLKLGPIALDKPDKLVVEIPANVPVDERVRNGRQPRLAAISPFSIFRASLPPAARA